MSFNLHCDEVLSPESPAIKQKRKKQKFETASALEDTFTTPPSATSTTDNTDVSTPSIVSCDYNETNSAFDDLKKNFEKAIKSKIFFSSDCFTSTTQSNDRKSTTDLTSETGLVCTTGSNTSTTRSKKKSGLATAGYYRRLALRLRKFLVDWRKKANKEAKSLAKSVNCPASQDAAKQWKRNARGLNDECVHLVVVQTLDWVMKFQQSKLFGQEKFFTSYLLAFCLLPMLLEIFHSDNCYELEPARHLCAKKARCTLEQLQQIQILILRAIDYKVYSVKDSFTVLEFWCENDAFDQEKVAAITKSEKLLKKVAKELYSMISDKKTVFLNPIEKLEIAFERVSVEN